MNFAIVFEAKANKLGVAPGDLDRIGRSVTVQLNRDAAIHYGGDHIVRVSTGSDLQPGEIVFSIVDDLPNAPNAIAYHDVDGGGSPVCFEALSMCSSAVIGPDSVSVALSHECLEVIGDPACNAWIDDGVGREFAHEICDGCESSTYTIDSVDVSDFVLPAFWNPHAPGPFSFVASSGAGAESTHAPGGPLVTGLGGYQIQRSSGTGETQVDGVRMLARAHVLACEHGTQRHHSAKRRHWSSRSYRRGLR